MKFWLMCTAKSGKREIAVGTVEEATVGGVPSLDQMMVLAACGVWGAEWKWM